MANYYSVNKVILVGNVVREPELRYTPQKSAVANFTIATNRRWKTQDGEIRDEAEFHNLVAWGRTAEVCNQILSPGAKVYVSGRLRTRDWEGDDKVKRYRTEIIVEEMVLLSSKAEAERTANKGEVSGGSIDKGISASKGDQGNNTDQSSTEEDVEDVEEEGSEENKDKDDVNPDDIPF